MWLGFRLNKLKRIGLLGGMSWQSTVTYYREINQGVQAKLGGLHSAEILLASIDFAPLQVLQAAGEWDAAAELLIEPAKTLEAAGADALLICTNTMHKVAPQIEQALKIPVLHIADATGEVLRQEGCQRVALLGTAFTMEQNFYKGRLKDKYGLDVLVPNFNERAIIHNVIYQELCLGEIRDESRQRYLEIINRLAEEGAEAIILGCTEIGLLVKQSDTVTQLIDTTQVHAQNAVTFILQK